MAISLVTRVFGLMITREGQSINEELYTYKNNKKLKSATTHFVFLPQIRMNRWWNTIAIARQKRFMLFPKLAQEVKRFTFVFTVYSLPLTFEDYWLGKRNWKRMKKEKPFRRTEISNVWLFTKICSSFPVHFVSTTIKNCQLEIMIRARVCKRSYL